VVVFDEHWISQISFGDLPTLSSDATAKVLGLRSNCRGQQFVSSSPPKSHLHAPRSPFAQFSVRDSLHRSSHILSPAGLLPPTNKHQDVQDNHLNPKWRAPGMVSAFKRAASVMTKRRSDCGRLRSSTLVRRPRSSRLRRSDQKAAPTLTLLLH